MSFVINLIVFEFCRVSGDFLVRNAGIKSTPDPIGSHSADSSPVRAILPAPAGKGCNLEAELLHNSLYLLLIDEYPQLFQFAIYAAVAEVFMP